EVLNPLTSLLTRVGIMERKIKSEMQPQLQMLGDISQAWVKDYKEGGFEKLVSTWKQPSQVNASWSLWQEDIDNLQALQSGFGNQFTALHTDTQFLMKEGARINKIINGMRKLANIRSDKRVHSSHEILRDCCHIMADLFEQRGYKVVQEFHADRDQIMAD